jgi:hypothetical protein
MNNSLRPLPTLPALVKPTLDTPFHIDMQWWQRQNMEFSLEVQAHLCQEHKAVYSGHTTTELIDWVDDQTGEVSRVDGPQHILRVHCSKQPDYVNAGLPLVASVLRVFLANGNSPLSSRELALVVGRPEERILHTLAGGTVYKGIRPVPRP